MPKIKEFLILDSTSILIAMLLHACEVNAKFSLDMKVPNYFSITELLFSLG